MHLSSDGQRILALLQNLIRSGGVRPTDPRTFLGYKDVHDQLGLEMRGATWGQSFLEHGGADLAEWVRDEGLPAITGLVIDRTGLTPGGDYFRLYGRTPDDFDWWLAQVEQSLTIDWSRYFVEEPVLPFAVGKRYTRNEIYALLDVPEEQRHGDWDTGSHRHDDVWFIFASVGTSGRTGHDYENHWQGNRLVWRGRTRSRLDQPKTQALIDPEAKVLIFTRTEDRAPFVFEGPAVADEWKDTVPVTIIWRFPDADRQRQETLPEELPSPGSALREGAVQMISVLAYERNPEARRRCIDHYGFDCNVCGFNFAAVYGELGEGFIHVHHLREIASIGAEYEVDSIADLRPVCPNCHAMLHRRNPCLSVEELRSMLRSEP